MDWITVGNGAVTCNYCRQQEPLINGAFSNVGEFSSRHFSCKEKQDLDYEEQMFRTQILRSWSRERQVKFCLHILGDEYKKKSESEILIGRLFGE